MANPLDGTISTSKQRLTPYRGIQRALSLAAAEAAAGHLDGRIEATLAAQGCGHLFADRAELAAAAQSHWWLRLLGRLDCLLDDDPASVPAESRAAAIQQGWRTTVAELPGYLALAASAAGEVTVRRGALRYARLLALFAGRATVDDDPMFAARAGLSLVKELSAATAPAASAPPWPPARPTIRRALSFSS
jgi:hypothetical protein